MIWVLVAILAVAPVPPPKIAVVPAPPPKTAPVPKTAPQQPLEKIADLMTGAGNLLGTGVSDKRVTDQQAKAVGLLDQLIASTEKQERKAGKQQQRGRQQARAQAAKKGVGQGDPTAPAAESVLPSQAKGDSKPVLRTQAKPGEAWGSMPTADRDRILQAIKKHYPSRYRDLVEQYFRQMNRRSTR